jgi:hypothetical protein
MFEWQDWALAFGIAALVIFGSIEALFGAVSGAVLCTALAVVFAYYFGMRAPKRHQADLARPPPTVGVAPPEPSTPPANWPPPIQPPI